MPARRQLVVESLERRAMLTVLVPPLVQAANELTTDVVLEPVADAYDDGLACQETTDCGSGAGTGGDEMPPEPVDCGSGGGMGGEEATVETTDPGSATGAGDDSQPSEPSDGGSGLGSGEESPSEPLDSGSGSGTGEGSPSDPTGSSSGSGTGEDELPAITSFAAMQESGWYAFTGTASDNESLTGQRVYLSSDMGHQFTATIQEDGSFSTMSFIMEPGTQITAYVIDADGNYSESAVIIV
jgi:hypothetical protein